VLPDPIACKIVFPVTFKVKNGGWDDDGSTDDRRIDLSRYDNEDLLLTLYDTNFPSAGGKPASGYKATGSWDVDLTDYAQGKAVSSAQTFTFSYTAKDPIDPVASMSNYVYGSPANPGISGNEGNGEVKYYYTTENQSTGGTEWVVSDPPALDAGDYYLYATVAETDDYLSGVTDPVAFTVNKADRVAPAAPEAETVSVTSIILKAVQGGLYSRDGSEWQDSPAFTGLEPNTEYTFRQKISEDRNYNESPDSDPAKISTTSHVHNWSFTAKGAILTATCGNTDGGHTGSLTAALTLVRPEHAVFGDGKNPEATITGSIDGVALPTVVYRKGTETLNTAPVEAGTYIANITLGGATASVEYTIENPAPELCVITFDPNGGTGEMPAVTVEKGTKYTLPACGFTPPAYRIFDAWDKGDPGEEIEITGDTVIKAEWLFHKPQPGLVVPAKLVSAGKTSLKMSWDRMNAAEGYDVFLSPCGEDNYKLYKTVEGNNTLSCKITGLTNGKSYKVYVRGWIRDNNEKVYISKAKNRSHAIAGGSSRTHTNPGKVNLKPGKLTLKAGKAGTLAAEIIGVNPDLPIMVHADIVLRWFSSDTSVATVDSEGNVTAIKEGTCTVWASTINGIRDKITVTVVPEGWEPADISQAKVTVKDRAYNGEKQTPKVSVSLDGKKLKQDTDYTVKFRGNREIGTATVTVTGINDYAGKAKGAFRIIPRPVKAPAVTAGKKELTVEWKFDKKNDCDGYQIQYGRKKSFDGAEKINVKGAKAVSEVIRGLKKGNTYYVRIRAWKKAEDQKFYSEWSEVFRVRVK